MAESVERRDAAEARASDAPSAGHRAGSRRPSPSDARGSELNGRPAPNADHARPSAEAGCGRAARRDLCGGGAQRTATRSDTRASIPLDTIRHPLNTPIWKLEAALKCRSCRTPRYSPHVHTVRLTETREVVPYAWVIRMGSMRLPTSCSSGEFQRSHNWASARALLLVPALGSFSSRRWPPDHIF